MSNLFEVDAPSQTTTPAETPVDVVEIRTDQFFPKSKTAQDLMRDPEVLAIADKIDMDKTVELYDLGKEPADEMSAISGKLLDQLSVADTIGSTKVLDNLSKIAGQIEFKELKPEEYKGIKGLFTKAEDVLKKRVAKYQSINGEVNTLFVSLKGYEKTIQQRVDDMNKLDEVNTAYAKNLDQYIALLYILRNRQEDKIINVKIQADNGDENAQIMLPKLQQTAEVLDKRAFDLEQAKTMAVMTAPQIKMTQENNYSLIQQYHSAFINTIPALQTGLVQAVTALQQNYAQQGLNAQKQATADLMKKNAERLAINNKFIAESAGKPMVSVEDMQDIVQKIVTSVQDVKVIEENNRKARDESRAAMSKIIEDSRQAMIDNSKN